MSISLGPCDLSGPDSGASLLPKQEVPTGFPPRQSPLKLGSEPSCTLALKVRRKTSEEGARPPQPPCSPCTAPSMPGWSPRAVAGSPGLPPSLAAAGPGFLAKKPSFCPPRGLCGLVAAGLTSPAAESGVFLATGLHCPGLPCSCRLWNPSTAHSRPAEGTAGPQTLCVPPCVTQAPRPLPQICPPRSAARPGNLF